MEEIQIILWNSRDGEDLLDIVYNNQQIFHTKLGLGPAANLERPWSLHLDLLADPSNRLETDGHGEDSLARPSFLLCKQNDSYNILILRLRTAKCTQYDTWLRIHI